MAIVGLCQCQNEPGIEGNAAPFWTLARSTLANGLPHRLFPPDSLAPIRYGVAL